ncbi:MAG: peptidylprolyl isomerase [Gammaproteobacteria bacterium]
MEMHDVLTTVSGEPITVEDVIVHLKGNGTFRNAIYQLIEYRVIAFKCKELRVNLGDQELRDYSQTRRRLLGLTSAVDMSRYCRWHGITMEQWNTMIRRDLLRQKLKDRLITKRDIEAYFEAHKHDFMMASVSRIVCAAANDAEAARKRIQDNGEEFATVARSVSLERNTRVSGGYVGCIKSGTLPEPINRAVFAARPGDMLGPFEQSGYWVLYRVDERQNTQLDETLRNNISEQLFNQWLRDRAVNARA